MMETRKEDGLKKKKVRSEWSFGEDEIPDDSWSVEKLKAFLKHTGGVVTGKKAALLER